MRILLAALAMWPHPGAAFPSPDQAWTLHYTRAHGYGHLDLTQRSTGRTFRMYRSNDGCCTFVEWLRPHLLVFVDDYRTFTLDPATKKVTQLAGFSNYVVSPNGRWIAGWNDSPHGGERVGVVSVDGRTCLQVPVRQPDDDEAAGFTKDGGAVRVYRRTYSAQRDELVRPRTLTLRLRSLRRC
jgi:hypothetical protein